MVPVFADNLDQPQAKRPSSEIYQSQSHYVSTPRQPQAKKKRTGTSTDTSIDAALNKLCNMADQDIFDNFGILIASQLRSIPMADAFELQADIGEMVNRRLLTIYRAKSTSLSEASRTLSQASYHSSQPSPSFSQTSSCHSSSSTTTTHIIPDL